jgi:hypothetical protein
VTPRQNCARAQRAAATIGEHLPFDARNVDKAPASPGVYLLYRSHRLIYLGLAAPGTTIRQCLYEHLRGDGSPCTRAATEFDYETSAYAFWLYRHYVAVYLDATGGLLPDCNKVDDR